MARRDDLERAREVLLLALDGNRMLQRGEKESFAEPAAGIVRELRAVIRELDEFDTSEEVATVDDIAARRKARLEQADDSASTARRGQSRRRGRSDRTG